jgi:hypothetical protein
MIDQLRLVELLTSLRLLLKADDEDGNKWHEAGAYHLALAALPPNLVGCASVAAIGHSNCQAVGVPTGLDCW